LCSDHPAERGRRACGADVRSSCPTRRTRSTIAKRHKEGQG
jgi:hypothetical protein